MLKEAVPRVSKIGVLWSPENAGHAQLMKELERGGPTLGVSVLPVTVGNVRKPAAPL